jgi:hypothetical protein
VPGVTADAASFGRELDRIQESLDGKTPAVYFPDVDTVDCYGVPKVGCVRTDRTIEIARKGFQSYNVSGRYEIVALEVFKLSHESGRYAQARAIAKYKKDRLLEKRKPFLAGVYSPNNSASDIGALCAYYVSEYQINNQYYLEVKPTVDPISGFKCEENTEIYQYDLAYNFFRSGFDSRYSWQGSYIRAAERVIAQISQDSPSASAAFELSSWVDHRIIYKFVSETEVPKPFAYRSYMRKDNGRPWAGGLCKKTEELVVKNILARCLKDHSEEACRLAPIKIETLQDEFVGGSGHVCKKQALLTLPADLKNKEEPL